MTVSIIGYGKPSSPQRQLFTDNVVRAVDSISPYLVSGPTCIVQPVSRPICAFNEMIFGNMPNDGGGLLLNFTEMRNARRDFHVPPTFIRQIAGSDEFINGIQRYCIWVDQDDVVKARGNDWLSARFEQVQIARANSKRATTRNLACNPYRFGEVRQRGNEQIIAVPAISSENRHYLPCGVLRKGTIVSNKIYALLDAPLWNMALIVSRLHWVWIGTVCVRMRTDFSYSNTLGWNTFPVPPLTENDKANLTRCAEDILLAREAHFPATIADLYDPEHMPADLRAAHERNDETLERIYIGRRFKNDSERLEKLFDMYTKVIKDEEAKTGKAGAKAGRKSKNNKAADEGDQA